MSTVSGTVDSRAADDAAPVRRRRFLVLPKLQRRLILWLAGISSLVAASVALAVLLAVWSPLGWKFVWAGGDFEATAFFWNTCMRVFLTTGILIAIFGAVAFLTGLIVSHRIAGPLYRMGKIMQGLARGECGERVALRHSDYMEEFSEKFNEMIEHVDYSAGRRKKLVSQLHAKLRDLEKMLGEGSAEVAQLQEKLQDALHMTHEARALEPAEACT